MEKIRHLPSKPGYNREEAPSGGDKGVEGHQGRRQRQAWRCGYLQVSWACWPEGIMARLVDS